jgi:hypothetical protein
VKEIQLTQGLTALVDGADFEWLNQWKWCAWWSGKAYYAVRGEHLGKTDGKHKYRTIYMHRQILGLPAFPGDERKGDHIETEQTLNNQRSNLRKANDSQSTANTRTRSDNTSGIKGVRPSGNGFVARIRIDGKQKHLGTRKTPEAAHALYVQAAQERHGEFARSA